MGTSRSLGSIVETLSRYWHTLRHLRPVQYWGRVWFGLHQPRPDLSAPPSVRSTTGPFVRPPRRDPTMVGPDRFCLLNREGTVEGTEDWNDPARPKLWLYHLHYFHDLNADGAGERRGWHRTLIGKWIRENPPGDGVGWEPYPVSIRIVNWIKWSLRDAKNALPDPAVHSLAVQARWLERRLERHLQGNHLLANAKALVFAGHFFEGQEAERWRSKGQNLLEREIEEQILEDGGHFERSPMYHALVLEDTLDIVNLFRAYGRHEPDILGRTVESMRTWLEVMRHPDGQIPFFNDAAFGMAPDPPRLDAYAERLGMSTNDNEDRRVNRPIHDLPRTGYVRVEAGPAVAYLDLAPVGPDHLPAHAHADTLCFELSLGSHRLFVNTGTSTYEEGSRRNRERSTRAHNTVVVDEEDSSEVWAAFRVGRRAHVTKRRLGSSDDFVRVVGEHDGYRRLKGRPTHRREWRFERERMTIVDRIEGGGTHCMDLGLHIHPGWEVHRKAEDAVRIARPDGPGHCTVRIEGHGELKVETSHYAPEFGHLEPIHFLRFRAPPREPPIELRTYVTWEDAAWKNAAREAWT